MSDTGKIVLSVLLSLLTAVVTSLATVYVADQTKEQEIQIADRKVEGDFVVLAVDILTTAPPDVNAPLRDWARKIITKYSGEELTEEAAKSFSILGRPAMMVDLSSDPQYLPLIEGTPVSVPALNIRRLSAEFLQSAPEPGARVTIEFNGQEPVRLVLLSDSKKPVTDRASKTPYQLQLIKLDPEYKLVILQAQPLATEEAGESQDNVP